MIKKENVEKLLVNHLKGAIPGKGGSLGQRKCVFSLLMYKIKVNNKGELAWLIYYFTQVLYLGRE